MNHFYKFKSICTLLFLLCYSSCNDDTKEPAARVLSVTKIEIGPYTLTLADPSANNEAPTDKPLLIYFSNPIDVTTFPAAVSLITKNTGDVFPLSFTFFDSNKTASAIPDESLPGNTTFVLTISNVLKGEQGEVFETLTTEFSTTPGILEIMSITISGDPVSDVGRITDVPVEAASIQVAFSHPVNPASVTGTSVMLKSGNTPVAVTTVLSMDNKTLTVSPTETLSDLTKYQLVISEDIAGNNGEVPEPYSRDLYTAADPHPDFPVITDEALLTLVQQQTFRYFWDFAHPSSGMARERNSSGDIVTSGGSGFGIMAMIVGMERNFITRQEGLDRMDKMLDFLETADRFHGVWPHWINGNTGDVVPFSANDNGGDLVETSFLIQGLLTFRQYLDAGNAAEQVLIDRINALWHTVEWDWYTREGQNVLYWHWSPDKQWIMNHAIHGYNEALITYFLAAASPTHTIDASVYHEGWANNGGITNNKSFYGITLPLGFDYGGPLFFAHYSFLGLDPRDLTDTYGNYWTQNVNHSLINHAHAVANPKNFVGYGDSDWGFTASDNHLGYSAHSPTNDLGVISPTAALSSFPYTPDESMKALKFFYYTIGDRLWGDYGFYDAFNLTEGWTADSYLAIDQGPIIIMIENHRTRLLWDLFMTAPEVQSSMDKLGFSR
jgi:hypothetical protein